MEKAESLSFPMVHGSGGRGQSLHGEILGDAVTCVVVSLILEVLVKNHSYYLPMDSWPSSVSLKYTTILHQLPNPPTTSQKRRTTHLQVH